MCPDDSNLCCVGATSSVLSYVLPWALLVGGMVVTYGWWTWSTPRRGGVLAVERAHFAHVLTQKGGHAAATWRGNLAETLCAAGVWANVGTDVVLVLHTEYDRKSLILGLVGLHLFAHVGVALVCCQRVMVERWFRGVLRRDSNTL